LDDDIIHLLPLSIGIDDGKWSGLYIARIFRAPIMLYLIILMAIAHHVGRGQYEIPQYLREEEWILRISLCPSNPSH